MIIKKEVYDPVLINFMHNISKGKISSEALFHFNNYKNSVLDGLKLSSEYSGLYDLFSYSEENNIEDNSLEELFKLIKQLNNQVER